MADLSGLTNLRPFIHLRRGPVNQLRRTPQGGDRTFRDSAMQHGQLLLAQIIQAKDELETIESNRPKDYPTLTDSIQLVVEGDIEAKILERFDFQVVDEREGKKLIAISPDSRLEKFTERIDVYMTETTDLNNPRYNDQIAPIDSIRFSTRDDKMGMSLREWIDEGRLNPTQSERYDVEIAGGLTEEGERNLQEFRSYLRQFETRFPSTEDNSPIFHWEELTIRTDTYSIHRVLLPGEVVNDLLDNPKVDWLLFIDRIPKIEDDTIRLRQITAGGIPTLPRIDMDAPRLVVIDSGIATGHPLFTDANNSIVGRQVSFLPTWLDPTQDTTDDVGQGHGTSVASIVAYGSINAFVLDNAPWAYPRFWVENAKVLYSAAKDNEADPEDDRAKLHDLLVPYWLMSQIVNVFHHSDRSHCRIFNLSIGANPVRLDKIPTSWSEAIDNLSAENDVLFVVASGNLQIYEIEGLEQAIGDYPKYLLDNAARLRDPAQAVNAITVGAFSANDILPATARHYQRAVASTNHPAPFTRTGLSGSLIVKPDVIEAGGNLSYDTVTRSLNKNIFELAVPVANRNFLGSPGGLIGYQCGTSLAAPKVTHLAGLIQTYNPEFSANLIRALIANSADWPEPEIFNELPHPFGTEDGDEIRCKMLQLCGYGIPKVEKALAANPYCIVLFAESSFEWDRANENDLTHNRNYASKVSFLNASFDLTDLLQPNIYDERVRISITLAYNPPVRKTVNDYQAVEMRWDLMRRGETVENFEARLIRNNERFSTPKDERPWFLKPVLNPGNIIRRGTVIKDWFDTELGEVPSRLEVAVSATVNDWYKPNRRFQQNFALVVSIECLSGRVPIYDRIRVRTQIPIRT